MIQHTPPRHPITQNKKNKNKNKNEFNGDKSYYQTQIGTTDAAASKR